MGQVLWVACGACVGYENEGALSTLATEEKWGFVGNVGNEFESLENKKINTV
jgi:hypothetical protein